jgi:hypothetical protein
MNFEIAKCPVCGAQDWHDTAAYPPYRWACARCYALAWFIEPRVPDTSTGGM